MLTDLSYYDGRKVCVIGGCGFIGQSLVSALLGETEAERVIVIDNLSTGRPLYHKLLNNPRVNFHKLDARGSLPHAAADDIVINLAAYVTNIEFNRRHNLRMFVNNMELVLAGVRHAIGCTHYIYASTVCVYPHEAGDLEVIRESDVNIAKAPETTNEGYGWAKYQGEVLGKYLHNECGKRVTVGRFVNAAGPGDHWSPVIAHVIPALIQRIDRAERNAEVAIWGSGKQERMFAFPSELALGLLRLSAVSQDAEPVNIAPDWCASIWDLANMICQKLDRADVKLTVDTTKPDGHFRRFVSNARLLELTGWAPSATLDDIVSSAVEEYKAGAHRA